MWILGEPPLGTVPPVFKSKAPPADWVEAPPPFFLSFSSSHLILKHLMRFRGGPGFLSGFAPVMFCFMWLH